MASAKQLQGNKKVTKTPEEKNKQKEKVEKAMKENASEKEDHSNREENERERTETKSKGGCLHEKGDKKGQGRNKKGSKTRNEETI
jgi:hypothetical protein